MPNNYVNPDLPPGGRRWQFNGLRGRQAGYVSDSKDAIPAMVMMIGLAASNQ
jgi:hypothetical protein